MSTVLRSLLQSIIVVLLLLIGFSGGWLAARTIGARTPLPIPIESIGPQSDARSQFQVFWEVWDLVEREYYGRQKLDTTAMMRGAIRGMLASLGDQYTIYQEPELAAQTQDNLQGTLGGIGTYLRITEGKAYLYKPFRDGPAYQAGLRQDDQILTIDSINITEMIVGLSVDEAAVKVAAKLRGAEGSNVVLRMLRASDQATIELTLIRRNIVVPSIEGQRFDNGIVYLRISEFKATTPKEFDDTLAELTEQPVTGIILDLRNNPGGYLNSAQEILGRFYSGTALYEEDGIGGLRELTTLGAPTIGSLPLVVLINGNSASASEIVAGALAERYPNTVLIGEKTFGKGSVQNIHRLQDQGSARITVAHWITPNKQPIHGVGIIPSQTVTFTDDSANLAPCVADRQPVAGQARCGDSQLFTAIQLLGGS
jgi:carboxyl-terminal processing protease